MKRTLNTTINRSKSAKNDECYTQPADIETYAWITIEYRTFAYDDWNLIHETVVAIDGGTTNVSEVQNFWGLDLSDSLQDAGGVGGLLAVSSNGQFYFPTSDNNGNVTKYVGESGNVVAAYEYDDFGRVISQSGTLADFFRHRFRQNTLTLKRACTTTVIVSIILSSCAGSTEIL